MTAQRHAGRQSKPPGDRISEAGGAFKHHVDSDQALHSMKALSVG